MIVLKMAWGVVLAFVAVASLTAFILMFYFMLNAATAIVHVQ